MLTTITFTANFIGLAFSLWLGFYLITRNPRSNIAWLTGLMLWSVGGMFLNILLALSPPPDPSEQTFWLRLLFPFWPDHVPNTQDQSKWLLGWTIGPAIVIWHHVTTLMRGPINPWRSFRISAGYLVAIMAVYFQFSSPWLYTSEAGDPLYINALRAGILYPVFAVFILLFTGWSIVNLYRSAKNARTEIIRDQYKILSTATVFAALAAPLSLIGTYFDLAMPIVVITVPLVVAIVLAGYGIARYSALVEGRTLRRDFIHSAIGSALMVVFYLAVTSFVSRFYNLPPISFVAAMFLALLSYSFSGVLRRSLDKVVYEKGAQELRQSLHVLNRLSESKEDLEAFLPQALEALSKSIRASYGLLFLFDRDKPVLKASCMWLNQNFDVDKDMLLADDVRHIDPEEFPSPFEKAAFLSPLYIGEEQIGAIVLGRPQNGTHFSHDDVEFLLDPIDTITDALYRARLNETRAEQINFLAKEQDEKRALAEINISVRDVEQALRNITDYAYLGDSPLASLGQVRSMVAGIPNHTHVDLGKAVYGLLGDTLDKLHPESERPSSPIPREWYPYVILYDAYMMDVPNRDIMSHLYISEGTFNRTRRAALRTVARMLVEMDEGY